MNEQQKSSLSRVFDILDFQKERYPQTRALNKFSNGKWQGYSIAEIQKRVDALSCWLLENDFKKGDNVAIIPLMGRPEWMIFDFACQQIGVVLVPIHPNTTEEDLEQILLETSPRLCLTADTGLFYKVKLVENKLGINLDVRHIEPQSPGYFEALKITKASNEQFTALSKIKKSINEHDMLAILYTSGTTGGSKGVMLTHANIVSNLLSILALFPLKHSKRVLSFLPFSHIMERTACYSYIACGVSLYFGHDRESFVHDFKTVRPYFCTMVPRILEKMFDYQQEKSLEKGWVKKLLIKMAFSVGKRYKRYENQGFIYDLQLFFVRLLVLNRWRRQLGGRIRYMVVGAASMRPDIARFFSAARIRIREGYGMTETSPLISLNRFEPGLNRFGTVGIAAPGVLVKIDAENQGEEGEILVKGPNVTRGYYQRPELTSEAFTDDGWFRTGDIGLFIDKKFLKITDRKKDIFKTSAGQYIAPQPLEFHFVGSPFIQQFLVIGFQRPYVTALVVPNFSMLEKWCAREAIHWTAPQFMVLNIKVVAKIREEIEHLNDELPNYKRVRNFVLCDKEWAPETGELTSNFKPMRKALLDKYEKEIENLYK